MRESPGPYRPPVILWEGVLTLQCRCCNTEFQARSRNKKRCDPCQKLVMAKRQAGYVAKYDAKRRQEKSAALQSRVVSEAAASGAQGNSQTENAENSNA